MGHHLPWLTLTLCGCGLRSLLPTGPVVKPAEQAAFVPVRPATVDYTGGPKTDFPILPLQPFGLQYAVDVVFVSHHPDWDMHEYARLDLPQRSVWIAKDSDRSGKQTIVADVENLSSWLPEIPAPRLERAVVVEDWTHGEDVHVSLSYINPSNEHVHVRAQGRMPSSPPVKRNGNTMKHSQDVVAAVLDIERFGKKLSGDISIGGEPQRFKKILGLVPFRFLLKQTQAGVAITNYRLQPLEQGFRLIRPSPAAPDWPTQSDETWAFDGHVAAYDNGIVQFQHRFIEGGLSSSHVRQHGLSAPTFTLRLQPALPDLRRTFEGEHTSTFVMGVNGQAGHGKGEVRAWWSSETTVHVQFLPTHPHWLASRPMETTIVYQPDGSVDVFTRRIQTP